MYQNIVSIPKKYVYNLNINGMNGRYLKISNRNKNTKLQILLVYGHHSSLERMYSLSYNLAGYGTVTMPDLPGFGGMESFYSIGKKPSLDIMAEYLATFIKLKYKKSKFVICGMSYGFLVVTRMLQIHPELAKQVVLLTDLVGFSHYSDFSFSPVKYSLLKNSSKFFATQPMAFFAHNVLFSKSVIYISYKISSKSNPKMKDASKEEFAKRVHFEQYLWKSNDARTYFYTLNDMLKVDLLQEKIKNLDLNHIAVDGDQYFYSKQVTNNLKTIFKKVYVYKANLPNHAPTIISDEKQAGKIIPKQLRDKLSKL